MNNFIKEIREKVLIYDGSKGYMLQKLGMKGGECPELWNVEHSEEVVKIYEAYKQAGADVIQTNTFQGNRLKLEEYSLGERTYELNYEGARLAKEVMGKDGFVAASIGPLGKLFEPYGELTFDKAYEIYKEQVRALADGGVDIINFETFTDLAEMRAALIAAKETCNLPVICSVAFESNSKTLMGTDPYTVAVVLESLGADMIGSNCSFGPGHLIGIIEKMHEAGGMLLSAKPNAGLPQYIDGETVYDETPEKFAELSSEFIKYGVRLIGGCCGTTPEFIKQISEKLKSADIPEISGKSEHVITSGVKTLNLKTDSQLEIGCIYADKDDELFDELSKGNMEYIVEKALDMASEGYDAVYINIDRVNGIESLLAEVVNTAQGYIREPFIIETRSRHALDSALRIYKGKAGIVVDDYDKNLMQELIIPAEKYGSTIVSRTMLTK